jgi:hypothetical protein
LGHDERTILEKRENAMTKHRTHETPEDNATYRCHVGDISKLLMAIANKDIPLDVLGGQINLDDLARWAKNRKLPTGTIFGVQIERTEGGQE